MPSPNQSKETKIFAQFLSTRRILIADPSAAARSGMYRIFADFGVKPSQIVLVNAFSQAQEQIKEFKPHIVLAEYELGKRCGLDLLQSQREQMPKETKEMVFIVMTGNTSQSAVAKAAEEDIDAYVIKPFTPEVVRSTIMKAALLKIRPPEYLQRIDAGKAELDAGNIENAEERFTEALALDASPALAHYYLGQVKYLKSIMAEAKGSYQDGLSLNKIHYKCSIGLYELLMKQKSHAEAYEVVKRISQYFPANPKRLAEVLKLAIINGKYEDVERYYSVFCNIDERDDTLIKYICAALVVCGRYYLGTNSRSRGLELFQKAAATGTGRSKILKEVVQALLDFNLTKDAKTYLDRFPPGEQSAPDYLLLKFHVLDQEGNKNAIIEFGRQLIGKGIHDEKLYEVMIQRSIETKMHRSIEALHSAATTHFPEKKAHFDKLIEGIE